jgi:DtxR family Mn-dependent transcriptional regulator
MATQTKEDYLKTLYALSLKKETVKATDLATEMNVSTPTISDMAKKLDAKGWLSYERYKPLKMTSMGKLYALQIIRKHRLSEMFLTQIMKFGWEEVHDIAEEMEHLTSTELFRRMDELLGFPHKDPHGSPIPDENGNVHKRNYRALVELPEGTVVQIKAIKDSSKDFLAYLNKKKISLKTILTIKQVEPFDKSYLVDYNDRNNQILSQKVCERLLVEIV